MVEKTAGIHVYLMEELTDARLRCDQLKRLVERAMRLVSESAQKEHIYEVAGDLLHGVPDALFRLDKALDATALAASRIDYEELKQQIRPEKVQELEDVLKNVRVRSFDRRAPQVSEEMIMRKLATGSDVAAALRHIAKVIDEQQSKGVQPSTSKIAGALRAIITAMTPTADEAHRSRFEEGKPADPTKNMDEKDAEKWKTEHERNKDNFKAAAKDDPRWIIAKYPGKDQEGKPFKKGENVLYFPRTKTFLTGSKADAEWRKFQVELADEDVYSNTLKSANEEHRSRFEEGKPADPTKNMDEDDAEKWKTEHEKHKDEFKSAAEPPTLLGALEHVKDYAITAFRKGSNGNIRMALTDLQTIALELGTVLSLLNANGAEFGAKLAGYFLRAKQNYNPAITSPAGLFMARFEQGKPADPTKNMDEEDATKWKNMNEEYGDKFKAAAE